jgi:tricorn protease
MRRALFLVLVCAAASVAARAETTSYDLLRQPTVSRTQIAFSYAGDLWIVDRAGGDARRLTANPGSETDPIFSPDGAWIAFTADAGTAHPYSAIFIAGVDGSGVRRLTKGPFDSFDPAWRPMKPQS